MYKARKLTKDKIEYLYILYAIWKVVSYYSNLFGIDSWEDPTKIPVDLLDKNGITTLRFRFHFIPAQAESNYGLGEIKEIMQKYLVYCILPEQKNLSPYAGGTTIYDIVEPLYIDEIQSDKEWWIIEVIYVDDPISYQFVKRNKWKGGDIL